MSQEFSLNIRKANIDDDSLVAKHLFQMAIELGVLEESIRQDWLEKTINFIHYSRDEFQCRSYIAEVDEEIIGSATCQKLDLYPMLCQGLSQGYVWGVYVEPAHRRRGIATALMNLTTIYLRHIGCTKIVLHASTIGKSFYSGLGYVDSNEMVLSLQGD